MEKKRKIIYVTGARSEYDIMFPVLELLQRRPDIDLKIVVTGAHLSELYGKTVKNIEEDGFEIADRVYNLIGSGDVTARVIGIGTQINGLTQVFTREKPDIVMVVGDREEAITVTLTAAYLNIAVAHLAGGDVAHDGNIDNAVRYAASKFAHIHFPFLHRHADVLRMLGEEEFRIFNTGNPSLDKFISCPWIEKGKLELLKKLNIKDDPYIVLIQHPILAQADEAGEQIEQTLLAIRESGIKCFINSPNSDPGNFAIIDKINRFSSDYPEQFTYFRNLDRVNYINLLRYASCLVGNSSSGIVEAPSIGLPVVNVGMRQRGRFSAGNVIYTEYDKDEIREAIIKSVTDNDYREMVKAIKNPYGDGKSAEKICEVLCTIKIDDKLIYKDITYKI